jgi:hypothetical protein
MRKIPTISLILLVLACGKDDSNPIEVENNAPIIGARNFSVAEHSLAGTSIGFVKATDKDADELTFSITSDLEIEIDEGTGELTIGSNLKLDYESIQNLPFTVSVFDGKTIVEKDFLIEIEDIDETSLLTEPQKELILYFQYLTLWKGPNNTPVAFNQRWEDPMKIYLMGNFNEAYKTTVENVSDQFNQFMVEGDFDISLTEVEEESNTQVFVGTKAEVAAVWPDMYEIIKDKTYDGYAITPSENAILLSSRIWLSSDYEVLFQHELGHALGLGHSDLCETDQSFMCSNISLDKQIMPMEQDIIKYLYHKDMHSGLSESEIEKVLANILLNE